MNLLKNSLEGQMLVQQSGVLCTEDIILQFLLLEFEKKGNKNFYFKARKISRITGYSSRKIGRILGNLEDENILTKEKQKLWRTNFLEK